MNARQALHPASAPLVAGAAPDWQRLLVPPRPPRRTSGWVVVSMACAHLLGLWALLQVSDVRDALRQAAPLVVDLIAPDRPPEPTSPPAAPTPVTPQPRPVEPPPPAPLLAAPTAAPVPAEAFTAPPPPTPVPVAAAPVQSAAPPAPPAPVLPPPRKQVAATAVDYLVQPPAEVPRASRRAGEHGTVWLRVVVDVRGQPAAVALQRSSGYARLDEQALFAMRQARFKPYTENGTALEVEVVAPIEYPQE